MTRRWASSQKGGGWWHGLLLWHRNDLEDSLTLEPGVALAPRSDRLERAFQDEWSRSANFNFRGTAFAVGAAAAILLLAEFSAVWLDDNRWTLPDIWDRAMQLLLLGTVLALLLCAACALFVVWPRGGFKNDLGKRLGHLGQGEDEKAARSLYEAIIRLQRANNKKVRWVRLASVFLSAAVIGTAAQGAIFGFKGSPVDAIPVTSDSDGAIISDEEGLPPLEERVLLADEFAPRVWLHPAERFGPLDPASFIQSARLGWQLRRKTVEVESRREVQASKLGQGCSETPGGCYAYGGYFASQLTRPFDAKPGRPVVLNRRRGFFLDIPESARSGQAGRDPDTAVFYEFRSTPHELLLTYWFFYAYSRPHVVDDLPGGGVLLDQLSHEGDWENIDIALSLGDRSPIAVYFYGHGTPTRVPWGDICAVGETAADCELGGSGHPVVYSALDSHASYADVGRTKVCGDFGCARDIRAAGFRWDTWKGEDSVRPVRQQAWFGFGGAWGAAGPVGDRTGPLGPSSWKLPTDPDPGDLAVAAD